MAHEGAPDDPGAFPFDEEERGNRFNKRLLIGIGVIVLTTAYLIFLSLDAASAVYMNVDEFAVSNLEDGRRLRLGGSVTPGSISYGEDGLEIAFTVHGTDASIPVSYYGVPPDIFGDNAVVFIEGYYSTEESIFTADVLLTRHPDTMEALPEGLTAPDYELEY